MSKLKAAFKNRIARFAGETEGTVAIEAVIALPILFWAFLASFVYFDAYRQNSINIKAAYTVGDMLSRETNSIDGDYLDGMKSLFDYLAGPARNTKMRVTVLQWDEEDDAYIRDWSKTRGAVTELTNNDLAALTNDLPIMADNERLILVETWSHYIPPFNVGLAERDMYNFVFTSPRFSPLLPWSNG